MTSRFLVKSHVGTAGASDIMREAQRPETMTVTTDQFSRPLHDLRISVTDRCNFRCTYCMPKEVFGRDFEFLPSSALLTFEEITRLARIFIEEHGVEKLRITGGEPLVRRDVEKLVGMLAGLPWAVRS